MSGPSYNEIVHRAIFDAEDDSMNWRPCRCGADHEPRADCYMPAGMLRRGVERGSWHGLYYQANTDVSLSEQRTGDETL